MSATSSPPHPTSAFGASSRGPIAGEQSNIVSPESPFRTGSELLQQSELNREGGGVVKVCHSIDRERMRRETLIGFYVWAGAAAALIEDANLTKRDYLEENPDRELPDVFWDSFPDR